MLLACRQWDPLGLARRLPSLGIGAWRSAPLLPWRVQCPVRVCAALAAGSGGSGRYLVLCLSRFPLPALRLPRCVWRAIPSRCPLPSLAGTPFHAVCAFRELGPVALLVFPACPLRVCALPLQLRPLPPPWVVWRAHLAVGPFHVVCAPPRVLPRSLALSGVLGGGAVRFRFPPTWLGAVHPPWGGSVAFVCRGTGWGGGGGGPCASCCGRGCAGVGARRCPLGLHALWGPRSGGVVGGVPGGVARHRCKGRLVSGGVPPPVARPLGGPLGSATHMQWAPVCGCGGPALSPRPACPVGAACREGAGGPPPGGVACYRCEGRLV